MSFDLQGTFKEQCDEALETMIGPFEVSASEATIFGPPNVVSQGSQGEAVETSTTAAVDAANTANTDDRRLVPVRMWPPSLLAHEKIYGNAQLFIRIGAAQMSLLSCHCYLSAARRTCLEALLACAMRCALPGRCQQLDRTECAGCIARLFASSRQTLLLKGAG